MSKARRFMCKALGLVEIDDDFPAPPGPQEHHENVEFMAEALEGQPQPRTFFDTIGPDGKLSDKGWEMLGLPNPHKKETP